MTLTASNLFQLQGQNPYMSTLGEMGDISNLCQLAWYKWIYFWQQTAAFPYQKEELGRCLGPAKNEGNGMCQWVFQQNGRVIPRRTLQRLRPEESTVSNESELNKIRAFDAEIKQRLGGSIEVPKEKRDSLDLDKNYEVDSDNEFAFENIIQEADAVDSIGNNINQQSIADLLINAKILLPKGDAQQMAKVLRQAFDANGNNIGTFNKKWNHNTLV